MANTKYTKSTLNKKTKSELEDLLDEEGFEAEDGWTKADFIEALMEIEALEDDEELDEVEDEETDDSEEEDDEVEDDEVDDIEVDEVDDTPAPKASKSKKAAPAKEKKSDNGEDTLAAKQVATELGVEARILRQFFRSSASTIEAVGSGGRYEFLATDLPKIKEEFTAWQANKTTRTPKGEGSTRSRRKGRTAPAGEAEIVEEVEELEIEDLDELDDEDLELED